MPCIRLITMSHEQKVRLHISSFLNHPSVHKRTKQECRARHRRVTGLFFLLVS